jgi:transcriptional regulator with XRE-family HTH domain
MPLEPEELKNRVAGARKLRGMSQAQLGALVAGDGHGKHDVGRLERGELILTRSLRRSLAEHLSVPEAWFVDETIEIPGSADDEAGQLDRIEERSTLAVRTGRSRSTRSRNCCNVSPGCSRTSNGYSGTCRSSRPGCRRAGRSTRSRGN